LLEEFPSILEIIGMRCPGWILGLPRFERAIGNFMEHSGLGMDNNCMEQGGRESVVEWVSRGISPQSNYL